MGLTIYYNFNGEEKTLNIENVSRFLESYHNDYQILSIITEDDIQSATLKELVKSTPIKVIKEDEIFDEYQYFSDITKRFYDIVNENEITINLKKYI